MTRWNHVIAGAAAAGLSAQLAAAQTVPQAAPTNAASTPNTARPSSDYMIGPDDVLTISFWRDKEMSSDVTVRPDGKITLPLVNDVDAAGLSPDQLRGVLIAGAKKYVEDPNPTVIVKQINSKKVFITGSIEKPGSYPITSPTTVLQLLAMAGGLKEYARSKDIVIMRIENGRPTGYKFNFKEVADRRNMKSNIELKPGDTVVVP
jgi:polysaccharide biosynthesis/export protein